MTAQRDPKDVADEFAGNLNYMQTLLQAAEDKVQFYLSNKCLLGPYWEVLSHHAAELGTLLALALQFLEKTDRELDIVMDFLYELEPPAAAR